MLLPGAAPRRAQSSSRRPPAQICSAGWVPLLLPPLGSLTALPYRLPLSAGPGPRHRRGMEATAAGAPPAGAAAATVLRAEAAPGAETPSEAAGSPRRLLALLGAKLCTW